MEMLLLFFQSKCLDNEPLISDTVMILLESKYRLIENVMLIENTQ